MAKSKFFRVAVAGLTASDGRTIEPDWLTQMAASYNTQTFTARVNVEHIRNLSPDGPFPACGDVLALKTEEIEIELNGKKEKRLALFAQIDPTEQLLKYSAARQKVFTSIEIEPNFAGTGKAYLMGLACTDSPASLGTEALKFSTTNTPYAQQLKAALDARKQHTSCLFSALDAEVAIELEPDTQANPDAGGLESILTKLFSGFLPKADPAQPANPANPANPITPANPATPAAGFDAAAFSAAMGELGKALAADRATDRQAQAARDAQLRSEFAALQTRIETTPERNHSARPISAGGAGRARADC